MRRSLLFTMILAAGCGAAPEAPRSSGGDARLEAPTPSSVTLSGLLSVVSTGYSNVQQARYLQEEAKRLGISNLAKPSGETGESGESPSDPIPYEEGIERTRSMSKQFAAQRRAIEKGQPKAIDLKGTTPGIIPGKPQGGPIEGAPEDGPKDLEKK
jgi:hypothetical protein